MKHIFLINPRSFSKKNRLEDFTAAVEGYFAGRPETRYAIHISRYPRDAIRIIHLETETSGYQELLRIYAVGGDGILFDCLNGMVNLPNAELGAIPYGKLNDFVRAFGEGNNPLFRNIDAQVTAPAIPTDVIYCGSNHVLNVCTIGGESSTLIPMTYLNRKYRKIFDRFPWIYRFVYYFGGVIKVFNHELMNQYYTISIDGEDYSGNYSTINIANGPCYGGTLCAQPQAVPNDGLLDVILVNNVGILKSLVLLPAYLHGKTPAVCTTRRIKKMEVRSPKPLIIELDGELFYDTNLTIEVVPQAIKFITPNRVSYQNRKARLNAQ
jgi:YegS/Rv2252/BmrU family lipid kinase